MATTAYLRVSTGTQDLANQKLAILEYARRKKFPIHEFVEVQISSRKKPHQRGIDGMLERLAQLPHSGFFGFAFLRVIRPRSLYFTAS